MKPDYTLLDQTAQALGCPLRADEPMARHTTFQIGGPADRFLTVENAAQLQGLLSCLRQAGIPAHFEQPPGDHTWDFWDREIQRVIDWLLP